MSEPANPPSAAPVVPPAPPVPGLTMRKASSLLGARVRWLALIALAKEGTLSVKELSARTQASRSLVSRHMGVMRRMGVVVAGQARLYSIAPAYRPPPGAKMMHLGACVLNLEAPE